MEKPFPPRQRPNREARAREYLTLPEAEKLIEAAGKAGRNGPRDAALLLLAYRHGLRASELVCLRWEQVDLAAALLHVRRVKNGIPATHPLRGRELRALRALGREAGNPSLCLRERAGSSAHYRDGPEDRRPGGPAGPPSLPRASAHAAARMRLLPRQRGTRHKSHPALPRAPEHPSHGALHRAGTRALQRLLDGLRATTPAKRA